MTYFKNKWVKRFGVSTVGIFLVFFLLNQLFPLPQKIDYSPTVYDSKNNLIHAWLTPTEKWRFKTELSEISPLLKTTILAKEDRWFYWHPGVNPIAVVRALGKNLVRGRRTSGASTITMQVARLLYPAKRTVGNKIIEMFRALQLEWKYSKNEILQLYINLLPYGGNIEGVKTASWLYFNKNPNHLSLAEITALTVIPNRPNSMVMGKNNAQIVSQRNKWLQKFLKMGVFTQNEIDDALAEPLTATTGRVPRLAPHLSQKLRVLGVDVINTTLETNCQLKAEKITADYVNGLKILNIRNAAVVVIDNSNNTVVGYVGSANFFDSTDAGEVNGAAAVRQPGSTLKPILYGLCIDNGLVTPKMTIGDVAVNYQGYVPENYDQRFNGFVSMEYALAHSLNIPAVKMLQQLGKDKLIATLSAANFNQIAKDEKKLGLSMILGGCGTTLEELTGLFAAFAHDGQYSRPIYTKNQAAGSATALISPAANYMLCQILSSINRPDFPINWQATENMPKIGWKTGTSYGRKDAWSIGFNKHYTIGVWVGNFSGQGIPELSGAQIATPLLFKLFNAIDYSSQSEQWFQKPNTCDTRLVCGETGQPPAEFCDNLVSDFFIPLVSPTAICTNKQLISVSPNEKISYCVECVPANGYKKKWYPNIGPDMEAYFVDNNMLFEKTPPHNADCQKLFHDNGPMIKSPDHHGEYFISKNSPEPLQLVCKSTSEVSKVYWYINNNYYKTANPAEKVFFKPDEGINRISCTDDKGRTRTISIQVKYVDD